MWGEPMKPRQTDRASRLVNTQQRTARESAPKWPRARFTAAVVTTSSPSSIMVICMASTMPEATCTERSAPVTGRPRVIQVIRTSSTTPMRTRRRRPVTKEP